MHTTIVDLRLRNQCITGAPRRSPADVVAWFGAVQAQEYPAARWGLALRMPGGATDARIARAVDSGRILRTHVMRPTWHFVTRADIRWMLELTAPCVRRRMAPYFRHYELDAATFTRAAGVFEHALRDGQHLTRAELGEHLERAGLAAKGVRLALITMHAELEGVMCSGAYRGKQLTYALLALRASGARRLSRDEALAELARRFFRSHGPATIRDFVWWSGLTTPDAKRGLEMIGPTKEIAGKHTYWSTDRRAADPARRRLVHLLPIYDEYLVAYRDRDAVPHATATIRWRRDSPVSFQNALVIAGQVAGTWSPVRSGTGVAVQVAALRRLMKDERRALAATVAAYGRFLKLPVSLRVM